MFDESYNTKQSTVPMFMLNLSWCFKICLIKFLLAKDGYLIFFNHMWEWECPKTSNESANKNTDYYFDWKISTLAKCIP